MNPSIQCDMFSFESVDGSPKSLSVDLASPLLLTEEGVEEICNAFKGPDVTLFLPAMPNSLGDGDTASNFRFKHDAYINKAVIERWIRVFREYKQNKKKNPVVITAVGRSDRYLTFKILETGEITVVNTHTKHELLPETVIVRDFTLRSGLLREYMKIIRKSSEGAKFNTYFADMIGFINMINWHYHPEMFEKHFMGPYVVTPDDQFYIKEKAGQPMLQPTMIKGREWKPREGHDYMYFKNPSYKEDGVSQYFYTLRDGGMAKVYDQLFQLLNDEDNGMKEMVRDYITIHADYLRLSDFWSNDIDDGFTIFMIMNSFSHAKSEHEMMIGNKFKQVTEPWFEHLQKELAGEEGIPEPEPEA